MLSREPTTVIWRSSPDKYRVELCNYTSCLRRKLFHTNVRTLAISAAFISRCICGDVNRYSTMVFFRLPLLALVLCYSKEIVHGRRSGGRSRGASRAQYNMHAGTLRYASCVRIGFFDGTQPHIFHEMFWTASSVMMG